jgi:hypothetical protein
MNDRAVLFAFSGCDGDGYALALRSNDDVQLLAFALWVRLCLSDARGHADDILWQVLIAHFGWCDNFSCRRWLFLRASDPTRHAKGVLSTRRRRGHYELMMIPSPMLALIADAGLQHQRPLAGRACLHAGGGGYGVSKQTATVAVMLAVIAFSSDATIAAMSIMAKGRSGAGTASLS